MTDEPMIRVVGGRMVPERIIKSERVLEEHLVRDTLARACALRDLIAQEKAIMVANVDAFKALLAEKYGVKLGGRRGGLQLHTYDQTARVEVSVADAMTFGPELDAAKALIDECLTEWSEGANENLKAIVMAAFEVGEGGRVKLDRVLGLRQLDIADEKWMRAMQAINDALRVAYSRRYLRIYERADENAAFQQVVLDASRL